MRKVLLGIFALLIGVCPAVAFAAALSFSPKTVSLREGETVSVALSVSSNAVLNAVSGIVAFPPELLEAVSLPDTSSIVRFWVDKPAFSNSNGEVSFAGIVPNPGFSGRAGEILSVLFRAKKSGSGQLSYLAGTILANDGRATELLSQKETALVVVETGVQTVGVTTPGITSPTHPDKSRWYPTTTATFTWALPPGAIEARTIISENPSAEPMVSYLPPVATKTITGLSDGIQYFGLMLRDEEGWSGIGRFRVNVDTTPPKPFSPGVVSDTSHRKAIASFTTTDAASGIPRYDVLVNGVAVTTFQPSESTVTTELPGTHDGPSTLTVIAYDKAGNSTTASATYESFAPEAGAPPVAGISNMPKWFWFTDVVTAVAVYAAFVVFTATLISTLLFCIWFVWHRMHQARRLLLRHLAETDRRLLDVQKGVENEITRLERESKERALTTDEQRTLKQLSMLVENAQHEIHRETEE